MSSPITEISPADPASARAHFAACLSFETDCADVHAALSMGKPDFVLADVRSPALYESGHIAGAINLPHRKIDESYLARWPRETIFVVYCAGPHCNGGHRAALRLSALNRPVKLMIGGVTGWLDEGYPIG
jgi:rhodanese-related sulfurtransferase